MNKKMAIKKGKVVSDKMDKTIVVAVYTLKNHPKYLKKYRVTKRYKVHDPENKFKIGDEVEFVQCRPISKNKRFKIAK
jgi:small subunit ribosomal protein S17